MSDSSRTVNISSIIAVICIAIYIMAIAFGAARIIESITERRNIAEREFYDISDRATSSSVFLGFMTEPYRETIRDSILMSETILAVIITGGDNEYAFERFQGSGIVWSRDSPRFKTGAGYPREPFTLFLRIDGQRNVSIKAIYSYIDYNAFVDTFKTTLLAVLIALSVAFVTLLIQMTLKRRAVYDKKADQEGLSETGGGDTEESSDFSKTEHETASLEADETGENDISIDYDDFDENIATGKYKESDVSDGFDIPEISMDNPLDASELPVTTNEDQNPQGLYTPNGNVGWESYTIDRLASELHRCSSFEQDLVFVTMEFGDDTDCDNKIIRQFSDEAVSFFTMRDLIFEKGKKGISVIIPNIDLETGLAKSEGFRSRVMNKLPPAFEGRTSLCIGLSSRSGRLVEANRLLFEAKTALEKALDDPDSPVIAFKSDLEKYREFIKKRS